MSSLEAIVRELRWSAARASAVQFLLHAALAATGWILAVLLLARLTPIEQAARVAAVGIPIAFAAVVVAWFLSRPRPMKLMRTADLQLGLKERLSTAWERRDAKGPLDEALQLDALRHATNARLAAAFPLRIRRSEASITLAAVIASLGLALLPNPMNQVLAQRHADQVSQTRAAAAIAATKKQLAAVSNPAPVDPAVQKILQDAQAKIANAPDPRSALETITPAEQQLLQLSDPQTPARTTSAQNLANSLATTNAGRTAGQAIGASAAKGAQSLRDLATQLQSLSPQDRSALANALADAARHSQDPAMAASMQKASDALAGGDLNGAAAALNDLSGQLAALQQQQSNDQEIAAAVNGLESARQQLAAQADSDAGVASTSPATGSPSSGSGGSASSGNGNGNGSGNASGNGTGSGNGSGTGSGNGSGGSGGSGGTGGVGASGSGAGAGTAGKPTERLYVPGQPVPGQSENDPTPLGPGENVPLTPYTQVVQAYQQAALDAANQSLIPGSERDLIREYFSGLGEAQAAP